MIPFSPPEQPTYSGDRRSAASKARVLKPILFLLSLILLGTLVEDLSLKPLLRAAFAKLATVTSKTSTSGSIWDQRRQEAHEGLQKMKQRGAFETSLTTQDSVLESGFPFQWNKCILRKTLQQKQHGDNNHLQFVLLGGSSSARPADNCRSQDQPEEGRFSNILQTNLQKDTGSASSSINYEIINRSQGSENSAWFGIHITELVDPAETDVLIWEGCINDIYSEKERLFGLWLARVDSLYILAGKERPPILFLCLWPARSGERLEQVANGGLLAAPMTTASNYVEYHRSPQQGWNIQAVDVGSTIDGKKLANNPKLLFDDDHHPSCLGVALIADMLEHAILSNIASCDEEGDYSYSTTSANQDTAALPSSTTTSTSSIDSENVADWIKDLWKLLMRKDVRVASISPWEPSANITGFRMGNLEEVLRCTCAFYHPAKPGRTDRKKNYILPLCSTGSTLRFVFEEPDLEWLGIGLKRSKSAEVKINDIPITVNQNNQVLNNRLQVHHIQSWLRIPTTVPKSARYTVSVCQKDEATEEPRLSQFVGLMLPNYASYYSE